MVASRPEGDLIQVRLVDFTDQLSTQRLLDIVRAINGLSPQTEVQIVPSGSTSGMPVKVTTTSTPGTLFHTTGATAYDNIWMFATNTDTVQRLVTTEFGDNTSPDHHIVMTVMPGDSICVISGIPLTGSKTVRVYAAAANVINVYGFINRVTPV